MTDQLHSMAGLGCPGSIPCLVACLLQPNKVHGTPLLQVDKTGRRAKTTYPLFVQAFGA